MLKGSGIARTRQTRRHFLYFAIVHDRHSVPIDWLRITTGNQMFDLPPGSPLRNPLAVVLGGVIALFALFALLAEEVVMDGRTWLDRATSIELREYATPERTEAVRAAIRAASCLRARRSACRAP